MENMGRGSLIEFIDAVKFVISFSRIAEEGISTQTVIHFHSLTSSLTAGTNDENIKKSGYDGDENAATNDQTSDCSFR